MDDTNILADLANKVCIVRDALTPIIEGKIERGHSLAGLPDGPLEPGFRKTKLADARLICAAQADKLNQIANMLLALHFK